MEDGAKEADGMIQGGSVNNSSPVANATKNSDDNVQLPKLKTCRDTAVSFLLLDLQHHLHKAQSSLFFGT
jgi:uncharacterized protein (DUF362 family)